MRSRNVCRSGEVQFGYYPGLLVINFSLVDFLQYSECSFRYLETAISRRGQGDNFGFNVELSLSSGLFWMNTETALANTNIQIDDE